MDKKQRMHTRPSVCVKQLCFQFVVAGQHLTAQMGWNLSACTDDLELNGLDTDLILREASAVGQVIYSLEVCALSIITLMGSECAWADVDTNISGS